MPEAAAPDALATLLGPAWAWIVAAVLALTGLVAGAIVGRLGERAVTPAAGAGLGLLTRRVLFWTVVGLFAASALSEVGVDLSVLLGAAGVFTVAIGFASQTSASNVISGVFLLIERPFAIGDVIRLGTTQGEVLSIDLLSVKLRTFDNLFVRVPNESVMKSEIVNVSRFPIRRFDLMIPISREADLEQVREVLLAAADASPSVLDEPRPIVIFSGFTEMGVELQLSSWAVREHFLELRNSLPEQVAADLRAAGIDTGAPQRVIRMLPAREDPGPASPR